MSAIDDLLAGEQQATAKSITVNLPIAVYSRLNFLVDKMKAAKKISNRSNLASIMIEAGVEQMEKKIAELLLNKVPEKKEEEVKAAPEPVNPKTVGPDVPKQDAPKPSTPPSIPVHGAVPPSIAPPAQAKP